MAVEVVGGEGVTRSWNFQWRHEPWCWIWNDDACAWHCDLSSLVGKEGWQNINLCLHRNLARRDSVFGLDKAPGTAWGLSRWGLSSLVGLELEARVCQWQEVHCEDPGYLSGNSRTLSNTEEHRDQEKHILWYSQKFSYTLQNLLNVDYFTK